ncbi:MAG: hypothetical protein CR991_03945 [Proteobacteria bacterium]|nr:MAG: hypothetical protein CR991_03945 [Pseudomonadota bacterium]
MPLRNSSRNKPYTTALVNPVRLFIYAQAFRFSSGRGRCFSPGLRSLWRWHYERMKICLLNRNRLKRWRVWLERC